MLRSFTDGLDSAIGSLPVVGKYAPDFGAGVNSALGAIVDSKKTQRIDAANSLAATQVPSAVPYSPSATSLTSGKVKAIDYLNADLAKHYGMSKSTAYQEALANTGYQRSVADMKAAGLNPAVLFGSGRGSPASSSVYAPSGGSGRSYGGRSSGNTKLFSGSAYSFLQAVGGLVGIAVTGKPDGFWIGSQTAKGAMGLLDSLSK